jgi:putative transposase
MKEKETKENVKIPRTHIEGALYYVTSRGDNNENIFKDTRDYESYLDLLEKYKEQYGFKLFSFVLMPNHLHLLIELKEGLTISDIMHDLNANYTKYFNAGHERKGHLFQERYKMVLLEKSQYLIPVSAYIHLNPRALGLIAQPKEYVYSSYGLFCGARPQNLLRLGMEDEIREVSDDLGGKKYEDVLSAIPAAEMELLGKDLSKQAILGRPDFIEKIKEYSKNVKAASVQPAAPAQPVVENAAHPYRKLILAGSLAVVLLGILTLYLYARGVETRDRFIKELAKKESELSMRLAKDRAFIHKDLEEKYQADMVSYQAMAKRLELEKQKVRKLEDKLDKGGSNK